MTIVMVPKPCKTSANSCSHLITPVSLVDSSGTAVDVTNDDTVAADESDGERWVDEGLVGGTRAVAADVQRVEDIGAVVVTGHSALLLIRSCPWAREELASLK